MGLRRESGDAVKPRDQVAHGLLMGLGLGLGGLAILAVQQYRQPDPGFADPAYRNARAAGADVSVEDWRAVKEQEQRALTTLGIEDDNALREWVGARASEIEPSEAELHAVWEAKREIFGRRTFNESREVLVRIARLRRIRSEIETASR